MFKKYSLSFLIIFGLLLFMQQADIVYAQNKTGAFAEHYRFSIPDSLKQHYNLLRKEYYYDYAQKRKQGDLRYYVAMVLHDIGVLKWEECDNYKKKYGVMCNQISREKLHSILHYIYSNYPGSCKAEQIFNYVKAIVPYKGEKGDYPRFPVETMYYHGGDCEDSAAAVAALLKIAGYTTGLYTIHDYKNNIHHCVCVCKVPESIEGDKWRIKEYYDWGHCWLILDPAYHHMFGYNPSWVKSYLEKGNFFSIPDEAANCLLIDYNTYKTHCKKMDQK
ncbi:MAG: transglutaminase domain-containing protein [Armatimonadota bacterium]